jgi:hypothetical protein
VPPAPVRELGKFSDSEGWGSSNKQKSSSPVVLLSEEKLPDEALAEEGPAKVGLTDEGLSSEGLPGRWLSDEGFSDPVVFDEELSDESSDKSSDEQLYEDSLPGEESSGGIFAPTSLVELLFWEELSKVLVSETLLLDELVEE